MNEAGRFQKEVEIRKEEKVWKMFPVFASTRASQAALGVKNPPASGLILGLGRSPGEEHGNPL